jgi:hypothetical protein
MSFLWFYLNNEGCELVAHVEVVVVAARLAAGIDDPLFGVDLQDGLRVLAVLAKNEPKIEIFFVKSTEEIKFSSHKMYTKGSNF